MLLAALIALQITPMAPMPKGTGLAPEGSDEAAVVAPIDRWFAGIAAGDVAAIRAQLRVEGGGGATIAVAGEDGSRVVRHLSWQEYLSNVKPGGPHYQEAFSGQPAIEIDGDIAMVWGEFTLSMNGKVATCGVDHFDMVREAGAWRVQNVTWSQRTTDCPGAP